MRLLICWPNPSHIESTITDSLYNTARPILCRFAVFVETNRSDEPRQCSMYSTACGYTMKLQSDEGAKKMTNDTYVTKLENGAYRVVGTRVSLDSVVYAYWRGESPETIADSFPALTLEQVYGAIAFYLGHQAEVDASMEQGEAEFENLRQQARQANPLLYKKLEEARRQMRVEHT